MKARKMGKIIIVLSFLLFSIISFSQTADESWVRIGVAFSGDITALAVSPDYETDTTIFIGVSGAGLWMSNDRGDSWTQCTAVPCDATVTGIALPQDYNFGGGDPCFAVTNEGYFYRSVDDFAGFTDVFSVTNPLNGQTYPMTSIVVGGISVFNNKVYIGLWGKGVYAHYSGGVGSAGWTYLGPDQINYCRSLTLSSEASQTLWASFNRDGGNAVLRYSGSGATWYSPNSYCPSDDVLVVRSSWVNPQYLWAGTSNLGMWRSTDGGNTWVGACDGQTAPNYVDYEVRAIRETPNSATDLEMWEGRSDGLRKSTSVGASCSDANPRAKINCIEFSPRYKMTGAVYCDAFVGTEQGLYRIECENFPASRTPVVVDGKAVAMAHDGKGYFMGSLTGGFFKSLTGRRNMVQYNNFPNGKIPQITAICLHPAYNDEDNDCGDANTLFVAANFPDSPADNGVYASGDGGNSWIKLTGGQWPSQPVEVRDLAISPNVSTDYGLFAATNLYLYRWNGLTGGWSRCGEGGPTDIYWVALTPTYNGNATCSYVDGGTTYYGYPCNMVWIGAKNGNANVRLFYNLSNGNGQFTELYPSTFCSNYPAACPVDVTGITFPSDFGVQDGNINHKIFVSSSTKGVLRNTAFLWSPPWVPFNDGLPRSNNSTPYTFNVVDITSDPDWINGDGVSENAILLCAVPSAYTMSQSGIYRAFNASGTPNWSQIIQGQGLSVAYETKTGNNNTEAMAGLGTNQTINPDNYGAFYINGLYNDPPSTIEHFTGYYSLPDDVSSSVAHERNPNYVFAASPSMGVFVSTNKGLSFRPFNEGAGGTDGPCRLTNGYSITMLKDRRETNIDALYVGTVDGIKARYILFSPDLNKIYLNLANGIGTPSSWLHSNWYSGGRTTGFWNRLEVIPLSGLTYPIWASSPGNGFANLDSNLYDGWRLQTTGLPSNPNVRDVRSGYDGANATTTRLLSGQMVSDVVKQNYWDYYYITTSYYNDNLQVILDDADDTQSGGGNPNLYIKYGGVPTDSSYDYYFGTDGDESACVAVITNESFDGSWSGSSPPSGWTITTNESPVTWNEDNWYRYYKSTPPRTYQPRVIGSSSRTSQNELMISPLFNLPSTLSSASVIFNHRLMLDTPGAIAYVKFKSTQNPTWVTLLERSTNMSAEATPTIDLSSYIGNTNCQIAFQYYDPSPATGRSWYFDNFEVFGYYNASAPKCLSLRPGNWYIGVKGGANNNNPYTLKVFLDNGCSQYPTFAQTGESGSFIPPDPKAPVAGSTWGTVNGIGVVRGSGTTSVMFTQTSAQPENLNLQTIIQLPDTTLIAGCDASSSSDRGIFYSPAGDEGETTWNEASSVANEGSKNYIDIIQASNGDVLIAANGTEIAPGGVWLSGDKGKNWMNISQGFDSESQELLDIVADNGTPPSYYSSTDATGLWTRTITASPYPTVTGITPASGPSTGGTSVTITGTGFLNTCPTGNDYDCPTLNPVVIFGDTEVEGTYINATSISAITPPQSAGEVVVKVRNPDTRESSAGVGFTYTFTCSPPSGFSNNTATDLNGCADEGVKIDWTAPSNWGDGGSGTRTYDILRNGSVIQTGLPFSTVTYTDTTGVNGTTYSYQVRANNGCGQSTTTTGASATDTVSPTAPVINSIIDKDPLALDGVVINFTAGVPATAHYLYMDYLLVDTNFSSGGVYIPGDSLQHTFVVKALAGECSEDSSPVQGQDIIVVIPPEVAPGDTYETAQKWNGDVQEWPATEGVDKYYLYRLEKGELIYLQNSEDEGCKREITTGTSYDCSLDDPSSLTDKVYFYIVTGYNGAGEGSAGDGTGFTRNISTSEICP